jgi:GNAT superfamily N-acetyltransferase
MSTSQSLTFRLATDEDIPALESLIPLSARVLQAPYYTQGQIEAALGPVFAVDRQLIDDRTYFVVECDGKVVGCGGWSRRIAQYGGGHPQYGEKVGELDPQRDPARIRAFFVHPDYARRGIGRMLLTACEDALRSAGFHEALMVATLAGEPLYASAGYHVIERFDVAARDGVTLEGVRMGKSFASSTDRTTSN